MGIVIGAILIKNSAEAKEEKVEIAEQNDEEIYDECTEEYESMNQENTLIEETSSESEKYHLIVQLYLEDITMNVDIL